MDSSSENGASWQPATISAGPAGISDRPNRPSGMAMAS